MSSARPTGCHHYLGPPLLLQQWPTTPGRARAQHCDEWDGRGASSYTPCRQTGPDAHSRLEMSLIRRLCLCLYLSISVAVSVLCLCLSLRPWRCLCLSTVCASACSLSSPVSSLSPSLESSCAPLVRNRTKTCFCMHSLRADLYCVHFQYFSISRTQCPVVLHLLMIHRVQFLVR